MKKPKQPSTEKVVEETRLTSARADKASDRLKKAIENLNTDLRKTKEQEYAYTI